MIDREAGSAKGRSDEGNWLPVVVVLLGAGIFAAALIGVGSAYFVAAGGVVSAVALAAAAVFAVLVVLLPTRFLPAVALLCYVLLPQQAVGYLAGAAPAAVVLAVWAVRRIIGGTAGNLASGQLWLARLGAATVLGWSLYLLFASDVVPRSSSSTQWITIFALGVMAPLLVAGADAETRVLWQAWPIITGIAACYVVLEYLLNANPLYDTVYAIVGRSLPQEWAVYRAHGSFGHPLYAATFFSVSAAAAFGRWISVGRGVLWFIISFVGLLATVSRGPLAALAIAVGVIVALAAARRRRAELHNLSRAVVLAGAGVGMVLASGLLQARSDSVEAQSSADARSNVLDRAVAAAAFTNWRGGGPAASDQLIDAWPGPALENSWLQIMISLGVVGLAGFAAIVGGILASSAVRGNLATAGAVVALTITLYGYEGIEGLPPVLSLFGILAVAAAGSSPDSAPARQVSETAVSPRLVP